MKFNVSQTNDVKKPWDFAYF